MVGQSARDLAWTLPGLWLLLTGLGIFSTRRLLPRGTAAVGAWYLLAGLVVLSLDRQRAVSPWTMGVGFGVGQLLAAAVLYFGLERRRDE